MQNNDKNMDTGNLLDEVLKTEPRYGLSFDFAEKVAAKASRRFAWDQYFKEFLLYLAAFAGFVLITAIMAFILYNPDISKWSDFLLSNISWVIGIKILAVFILFADRVLLRYLFFKQSLEIV